MDIVAILQYFGITADKLTPLLLVGTIFFVAIYRYLHLPLKKSVRRITNALIEIQTLFGERSFNLRHCLTEESGSPLRPTEYGVQLIKESGLEKILNEK